MTPKQAAKMYAKTESVRSVMTAANVDFYRAKQMIIDGGGVLLSARRKSKLSKDKIVELYATKGIEEIGQLNGTSAVVVLRVLRERGVTMRSRGNNAIHGRWVKHGHCQQAALCGMNPYRYVRAQAILALGGKCVICGVSDLRVLDINHINGKDCPQKKEGKTVDLKYQEHLRILDGEDMPHIEVRCCNCNRIHEYERGNLQPIPDEFYAYTGTNRSFYDRPN
jgi:hypothetical protein